MFFEIYFEAFLVILLAVYGYYKIKRALLVIQQSGYDNKRFTRYFKTDNKDTFPLNELVLAILGVVYFYYNNFILLLILIFFAYYNQKFMFKVINRYKAKKKLVLTSRVKRLLITYTILSVIYVAIFIVFKIVDPIVIMSTYIFFVYVILLLANIINIPIEKSVKNHYIKMAKNTLKQRDDLLVVGITGSYGKTSIKNIIGSVLSEVEPTLITPESFNTPMGLTITVNNYLDVFHKNFIAEMGAYYEYEIEELANLVSPKVGIVSSVGPQHLETFGSIETILKTKLELIESLPTDGLGILNLDNEYIRSYEIKNQVKVKYYSLEDENADIYAKDIEIINGKTHFKVKYNGEFYEVITNLLGRHNVENILAALLVCEYKGLDIDKTLKAIKKLKPVEHRLQYKYISENLSIIDDAFNSNVKGIREAISVLSSFEDKKKILITPGLIDLGKITEEEHVSLAKFLVDYVDEVYIVGQLNREFFKKGFEQTEFKNIEYVDNFLDAYNKSVSQKEEKVILIANDLPDKFR